MPEYCLPTGLGHPSVGSKWPLRPERSRWPSSRQIGQSTYLALLHGVTARTRGRPDLFPRRQSWRNERGKIRRVRTAARRLRPVLARAGKGVSSDEALWYRFRGGGSMAVLTPPSPSAQLAPPTTRSAVADSREYGGLPE